MKATTAIRAARETPPIADKTIKPTDAEHVIAISNDISEITKREEKKHT